MAQAEQLSVPRWLQNGLAGAGTSGTLLPATGSGSLPLPTRDLVLLANPASTPYVHS
jgi:hypothetical protein